MRSHLLPLTFLFATCLNAAAPAAVSGGNSVTVHGASNIRHFVCSTSSVAVMLEGSEARSLSEALERGAPIVAEARAGFASFDCGVRGRTRHMLESVRADVHPDIVFRLTSYELDPGKELATIGGVLSMNGVDRPITFSARLTTNGDEAMQLSGEFVLALSDFAIAPPRRFFGLLRVRDEIRVEVNLMKLNAERQR